MKTKTCYETHNHCNGDTCDQTKHTPTPWTISDIPGDGHLMAGPGKTVAMIVGWPGLTEAEFLANKTFIRDAVNSHERQVNQLQTISVLQSECHRLTAERDALLSALRSVALDLEQLDYADLRPSHQTTLTNVREEARAALALCEGGAA